MKLHEITEGPSLIWMLNHQLKNQSRQIQVKIKMSASLSPTSAKGQRVVSGTLNGVEVRGTATKAVDDDFVTVPTFVLHLSHHVPEGAPDTWNYLFLDATDQLKLIKAPDGDLLLTNK